MIGRISFRTAANGGHADAVGVAEMNLEGGDRLAVLHLHQRHPVGAPYLPKGVAFGKQRGEPVAIDRHRLGTYGMQRHQDVIASVSESADPVLRVALAGIADQFRPFGGAVDERAERLERERRNAIPDLQRNHSRPGDAEVQAIVGLATRSIGGIVPRSRLEPDVPVFGSGDLWRVGLRRR